LVECTGIIFLSPVGAAYLLSSEQNVQECDATGDDSSNAAGLKEANSF